MRDRVRRLTLATLVAALLPVSGLVQAVSVQCGGRCGCDVGPFVRSGAGAQQCQCGNQDEAELREFV